MATKAGTPATPRFSPKVVCSAFVEQYYNILHATPDQVHRFYQDTSTIGRARSSDGVMEYATTLPEINKKVMSVDYSECVTEIVSADAVLSHNGGVHIVVTGSLTKSDGVCQRFTQSFVLAPQEAVGCSYFVLSDILRVTLETSPVTIIQVVDQQSGSSHSDGSVAESGTAERLGPDNHHVAVENTVEGDSDWEVLNHTEEDGITAETNVSAEPSVPVTEEGPEETPDAASPPPPQAPMEAAANRSYVSVMTSLFSRLLDVI